LEKFGSSLFAKNVIRQITIREPVTDQIDIFPQALTKRKTIALEILKFENSLIPTSLIDKVCQINSFKELKSMIFQNCFDSNELDKCISLLSKNQTHFQTLIFNDKSTIIYQFFVYNIEAPIFDLEVIILFRQKNSWIYFIFFLMQVDFCRKIR
jgi:hypothetical protein